jgi:hypothetical protein
MNVRTCIPDRLPAGASVATQLRHFAEKHHDRGRAQHGLRHRNSGYMSHVPRCCSRNATLRRTIGILLVKLISRHMHCLQAMLSTFSVYQLPMVAFKLVCTWGVVFAAGSCMAFLIAYEGTRFWNSAGTKVLWPRGYFRMNTPRFAIQSPIRRNSKEAVWVLMFSALQSRLVYTSFTN